MKTTIQLDSVLHRLIKLYCIQNNIKNCDFVAKLCSENKDFMEYKNNMDEYNPK